MVYITLDKLKEILPEILDDWIGEDDEGWEWIFQEIEQECHVGKKKKDKKWKKKLRDDVDELQYFRHNEYEVKVNGIATRVNELSNKISNLSDKYTTIDDLQTIMVTKVNRMDNDIRATKLMAQTAKQRTDVDYTKCSKEKSDADVAQKEIPVVKKMCMTCKYSSKPDGSPKSFDDPPCCSCNHNDKWEAKDDG